MDDYGDLFDKYSFFFREGRIAEGRGMRARLFSLLGRLVGIDDNGHLEPPLDPFGGIVQQLTHEMRYIGLCVLIGIIEWTLDRFEDRVLRDIAVNKAIRTDCAPLDILVARSDLLADIPGGSQAVCVGREDGVHEGDHPVLESGADMGSVRSVRIGDADGVEEDEFDRTRGLDLVDRLADHLRGPHHQIVRVHPNA